MTAVIFHIISLCDERVWYRRDKKETPRDAGLGCCGMLGRLLVHPCRRDDVEASE